MGERNPARESEKEEGVKAEREDERFSVAPAVELYERVI